jgi:ABC-type dipeptide/oligopeptide/nickel transport system permease component
VVEIPFGLYGIGEVLYQAASRRDTHLVVGCLVFLSALVCGAGLLRDFARLAVDPRLRRAGAPRLE